MPAGRYFTWMLYFLAGGVAGAAVALFLPLQSGKVTRETMGRMLQDNTDSTRRGEAV
jgi:gas vesicle protein